MKKRQIKKNIQGLCGGLACDCAAISSLHPDALSDDKAAELIVNLVKAQKQALKRLTVAFPKAEKDFANRALYRRERSQYYRQSFKSLSDSLMQEVSQVVKELNAITAPAAAK